MTKGMNAQIVNEAADWAVRVDAGPLSPSERTDLADWLNASPVHIEEFLTASAMLSGTAHAHSVARIDLADLMTKGSAEIVELASELASEPASGRHSGQMQIPTQMRRRPALIALAAVCAFGFILMAASVFLRPDLPEYEVHMTSLGEQRTLALEDGSLIHLNTQSEVRIAYTDTERRVDLIKGEALFDIETEPERPFKVNAGDTVAEALGTVFNVRLLRDSAVVSVVEGKVRVDQRDALSGYRVQSATPDRSAQSTAPAPLDSVVLTDGKTASVNSKQRRVDLGEEELETIISWRDRKIVFERRPLAWVVDEFNRYNRSKLVVTDDDLQDALFSGTFDADDPKSFVMFLEQHHDMRSIKVGRDTHLRR